MLDYKSVFLDYGLELTEQQIKQLKIYSQLLKEWNQKMNLTAVDDEQGILYRHFVDSLSVLKFVEIPKSARIVDIGTGAGLPGLPLAIVTESLALLFDALNKRIEFLKIVLQEAEINNVELRHSRAEELGRDANYRGQFDFAFSRAVSSLNVLIELAVPLLKVGASLIVYKSAGIEQEIVEAEKALTQLGAEVTAVYEYKDYKDKARKIVQITKVKETSAKYPRRNGIPNKRPLK